ncbi:MAG: diacylglycerol kinase family protein [Odoribacter splanchnicus]|nr:diacylglycerol kinase family protein [Odoribacter splanchnicus]
MKDKKFSIKDRIRSFKYAFKGIHSLIRNEHNARIHLCAAILVVCAGFFFGITREEWIAVIFAIGFVFSAEAVNSAIEYVADAFTTEPHELIGKAKDFAAGAVLLAAMAAAIIGSIIFIPYFRALLKTL